LGIGLVQVVIRSRSVPEQGPARYHVNEAYFGG